MKSSSSLLVTWRDVRERLRGSDGPWRAFDVDAQGVRLFASSSEKALEGLGHRLGPLLDPGVPAVELISSGPEPRRLPVEVLPEEEAPGWLKPVERPLWSTTRIEQPPAREDGQPVLAAFFSFKGGVGRTTTCFATLTRILAATELSVLYIDADVQAPGLTWMVDAQERLSWLDVLALVHDADDWRAEALPLLTEHVALSHVGLELTTGRREFLFIPAARSLAQVERIPVTPEQVVRRRGRAWVIGDVLIALARALNVDVVLVDLRAGLTEFASPMMLDPRVRNVLTTSCAPQSVEGTCHAIRQVQARASWSPELDLVITQVPPSSGDLGDDIERQLIDAWVSSHPDQVEEDGEDSAPLSYRVDFEQQLLVFDDLEAMARRLPGASLWRTAGELVERLVVQPSQAPTSSPPEGLLERLAERCEQLEFAEQNTHLGLLPTPPLQTLARVVPGQLPNAVVLGSKGAGKTFTWGQLVIAETWNRFVEQVSGSAPATIDAQVMPLLMPKNLNDALHSATQRAESRGQVAESRMISTELGDALRKLHSEDHCVDGVAFWLDAIAARLGLPQEAARSVRALEASLRERAMRRVLVVDGLEDALQIEAQAPMHPGQKVALRGLLMDLVDQLRDLGARHLGLIVFVREDLARAAIPQNFGQFAARHRSVALSWSPEDALRLVLWMVGLVGWELMPEDQVLKAPYEQLSLALHPFWDEKMGGQKQAYTDSWVIAALSDLNLRFQARDLVRLIRWASHLSSDVPLEPAALRRGIEECSREKVKELESEVPGLKKVFDRLRVIERDQRNTPMDRATLGLADQEVEFLQHHGVLYFDESEEQYYLPEIIRHGLDFGLSRRGLARVLKLRRDAARRRRARA